MSQNLRTFIDGAEHGVILFSIGSFIQSYNMPLEMLTIFRETFAQIPQRVLWKSEKHIKDLSGNVLVSKWFPQSDILGKLQSISYEFIEKQVEKLITSAGSYEDI